MAQQVLVHNEAVLASLTPGDLVEFKRGYYYSHWAIYKGNSKVVHLAGDENDGLNANLNSGNIFTICGKRFNKAFVRVDDFWEVAGESKADKNNSHDGSSTPLSPEEIIEKAMEMIGEIGYNLLWGNFEHFAKFCRYGKAKSKQVDDVFTAAAVAGVATLGAIFLSKMFGSSKKEDSIEEKK